MGLTAHPQLISGGRNGESPHEEGCCTSQESCGPSKGSTSEESRCKKRNRFRSPYLIVDRLFGAAELRLGGDKGDVVRIERTDGVRRN